MNIKFKSKPVTTSYMCTGYKFLEN